MNRPGKCSHILHESIVKLWHMRGNILYARKSALWGAESETSVYGTLYDRSDGMSRRRRRVAFRDYIPLDIHAMAKVCLAIPCIRSRKKFLIKHN